MAAIVKALKPLNNWALRVIVPAACIMGVTICSSVYSTDHPSVSSPANLVGMWEVTNVLVDTGATRTLNYRLGDPRLKGRVLNIASDRLTFNTPEDKLCTNPSVTLKTITAASLIKESMASRGLSPHTSTPKDYELPLSENAAVQAEWVSCKGGRFGPTGKTWIVVMPDGQLAVRWFDSTILLLSRLNASKAPRASFDCAKAAVQAEQTICGSVALAAFDRSVSESYADALKEYRDARDEDGLKKLQAEQKAWILKRNACASDPTCLEKSMQDRLDALEQSDDTH
jgi:uncharacterized protein YecT (DUF1311 family)